MKIFTPVKIGSLELKNRIVRAGCFEGMCQEGRPSEQLISHHEELARGGIAMTTVAYCSVSQEGRAYGHEMWIREEIIYDLKRLTDAVHKHNSKVSLQLGHCGFFSSKKLTGKAPIGPSKKYCTFRNSFSRSMVKADFEKVIDDFRNSAKLAMKAGFDAIELHSGHGYLLSQFLSPFTNKRKDEYGESLENRLRFPLQIIKALKEILGNDCPLLVKMNVEDGFKGGLTTDEACIVAKEFEKAGADALIASCGFTAKNPFYMLRGELPIKGFVKNEKNVFMKIALLLFGKMMVPYHGYEPMFLFEKAKEIKDSVSIPVALIGGVCSLGNMNKAMDEGFEFVQIGRASIMDTDIVNKMQAKEMIESDCDHCNRCVAAMDGGGVYCVTKKEKEL